jgi:hypothetical protein
MILLLSSFLGLLERVGWGTVRKTGSTTGEACSVAAAATAAVGRGWGFADAFAPYQGSTRAFAAVATAARRRGPMFLRYLWLIYPPLAYLAVHSIEQMLRTKVA